MTRARRCVVVVDRSTEAALRAGALAGAGLSELGGEAPGDALPGPAAAAPFAATSFPGGAPVDAATATEMATEGDVSMLVQVSLFRCHDLKLCC